MWPARLRKSLSEPSQKGSGKEMDHQRSPEGCTPPAAGVRGWGEDLAASDVSMPKTLSVTGGKNFHWKDLNTQLFPSLISSSRLHFRCINFSAL